MLHQLLMHDGGVCCESGTPACHLFLHTAMLHPSAKPFSCLLYGVGLCSQLARPAESALPKDWPLCWSVSAVVGPAAARLMAALPSVRVMWGWLHLCMLER